MIRLAGKVIYTMAAAGVLLYTGVGIAGMLMGGEFLNYSVLHEDPITGQHWGIWLIELGVGLTVASVMISLFLLFANYTHPELTPED